jgi:protein MON2
MYYSFMSYLSDPADSAPNTVLDPKLTPSQLIPVAIQRSPVAHLFHFYPLLCEIAALPTKPPSAWVVPSISSVNETATVQEQPAGSAELLNEVYEAKRSSIGITLGGKVEAVEVNSRQLSRDCLIAIGRELGSQV